MKMAPNSSHVARAEGAAIGFGSVVIRYEFAEDDMATRITAGWVSE